MLTIHTSGGKEMMLAAMEAISGKDIKVFGVTALTSLSDEDTEKIYKSTSFDHVSAMLDLAESAGIDGVVCSPHELNLVSKRKSLLSITPGIRIKNPKMIRKESCHQSKQLTLVQIIWLLEDQSQNQIISRNL